MHLNGKFFEKLIFLNTVEAKVIILTWYVQSSVYKKVSKVKVNLWPFSQGRSYWSPINILKHSFLRNHLANWNQISYDNSLWLVSQNCYKFLWSYDLHGHHAHIWSKLFKSRLLWKQKAIGFGTWYVAMGM